MKRNVLFLAFFIFAVCARAQFSAGNLVVSKIVATAGTQTVVTNGDNTNNGYFGNVQEYTKSGAAVGSSIALTGMVFDGRNIAQEASLALSKDGKSVTIVGFDGGLGTNSAGFRAATIGKKIARIAADQTIAYTNILGSDFSANGYRCVFTADGSKYGVGVGGNGNSPYRTIAHGANVPSGTTTMAAQPGGGSTEQFLTPQSTMRTLGYTGGANTLYGTGSGSASTGGIYKFDEATGIGTNVPLDPYSGEITKVILFDTDANPATGDAEGNDVMYASNRTSGVGKFIWNTPNPGWNTGTGSTNYLNAELRGLDAAAAGPNEPGFGVTTMVGELVDGKPTFYCISFNGNSTGSAYSSSHLIKIVDNTAANVVWGYGASSSITILASTTNTESFKSVSFVPQGTINLATPSFEKKAQSWTMYPNPSKGILNINSDVSGSFNVYNVLGQKVHQFKVENGSNTINVDKLTTGTYFVEGANATQKLMIQK